MGGQYPKYAAGVEGDTPSFLYLMPTGLNDPDDPSQCSWGWNVQRGLEQSVDSSLFLPEVFHSRFYPAAFNNFAARMDWAKDGTGNRNPVVVVWTVRKAHGF